MAVIERNQPAKEQPAQLPLFEMMEPEEQTLLGAESFLVDVEHLPRTVPLHDEGVGVQDQLVARFDRLPLGSGSGSGGPEWCEKSTRRA